MWEIKRRLKGNTLWQGRDAEGHRIYTTTRNHHGMPMEPVGDICYYTIKQALAWANVEEPETTGEG